MILDHQWPAFHRLRNHLAVITVPIDVVVDTPIKWISHAAGAVTNQEKLLHENASLRANQFLMQAKLQRLLALENENAQLKALLKSTIYLNRRVMVADLLAVSQDSGQQVVVLDKGRTDRIYIGQPVLDAYGVMGQVVDLGEYTAKVLLITDKRSAIPVRDYRDGVRAIAIGDGMSGRLSLINVPDTADVKVGDLFVSSGLGLRYPVGYPVGVVTQVVKSAHKNFALIHMQPSAHMNRSQQVLLTWPVDAKQRNTVIKLLKKPLVPIKLGGRHAQ